MKNIEEPISNVRLFKTLDRKYDTRTKATLTLAVNEFTDRKDAIGLYKSKISKYEYLSIDTFSISESAIVPGT